MFLDVCKSSFQNNLEHIYLVFFTYMTPRPKKTTNGLNVMTKMHHIQMKKSSRIVVLVQKWKPVPHLHQTYRRDVGITSSLHIFDPSVSKKLKPPTINLREK